MFVMMTLQEKTIGPSPSERRAHVPSREAELMHAYGSNSLAFFGQALENSHFLAPDGAGLVHYRLVNKVAVVLGDPVRISWYEGVPPSEVMQQLEQVSSAWLEHKAGSHAAETGFSTGRLDDVIESAERADAIAHLSVPFHNPPRAVPRLVTGVATT